ncbi:MAG: hypothetical protein EU536_02615 [Promethearchaeota archaeon]|nr:MAG: hypothetical protein EU536_02615 [Candidatus Lokiarchaeota archaeon]
MVANTICFGFDGICADMSFIIPNLPKYRGELLIKYPFLEPIFELLLAEPPQDCELQFENTEMGFETFFDCIFSLGEIAQKKTTHIGGNAAIETVTAINLLLDPIYPIDLARVNFLGNHSTDVTKKLPKEQQIAPRFLEYANTIKTNYIPISIIIPYRERRGIISFGGLPSLRRIESLRAYLKNMGETIGKIKPALLAILGATNVYATTTNFSDFKLLNPFLKLPNTAIDLGGTVGWSYDRLKRFYDILDDVKIVMGNDDEFRAWYNFKFNQTIQDSDPLTIFKLAEKLRKEDQIAVCHTQYYQFVLGIDSNQDIVQDCMNFANKATVVKTELNSFPTAKQVAETDLQVKELKLPEIMETNAIVARSFDKEIANPVGLGDVWSCSFNLGLLSQKII